MCLTQTKANKHDLHKTHFLTRVLALENTTYIQPKLVSEEEIAHFT